MAGSPVFRDDLYRGTTPFYDRYRLPYPAELIDHLCRHTSADGAGRLLDVACGPGTVTFALADRFAEVWAVDLEPETIAFATRRAEQQRMRHIRWIVGRAEDVDADGTFDLVTIGQAFHRLDRARVAARCRRWLHEGGYLALLWSSTPLNGTAPWQRVAGEIVVDWMQRATACDRLPADLAPHIEEMPHVRVLEEAGFDFVGRYEVGYSYDWTPESLIGFIYSTSLLPQAVLGDRSTAFEADVRERLHAIDPSGVYREEATFAYDLARSPA